jgi:membrane associated rhomboid family serine protease
MFPLFDSTPRRTTPFVNYLIILINIFVFWKEITATNIDTFITQYSFIPSAFHLFNVQSYIPLISSLFLHGSILHILSNMWFLRIFGDNVEDQFGHLKFLIFYLVGGVVATLAQYFVDPSSSIPVIGASGAISAVAGAYFVMFRHSTVKSIVPIFFLFTLIDVPVWLFLGYWFFIQIFSGLGSFTSLAVQDGSIAWFSHVGGFLFGLLVAKLLVNSDMASEVEEGRIIS